MRRKWDDSWGTDFPLPLYVTTRPHVLFVPQIPDRRHSSWTIWEWSTKRLTSGPYDFTYQENTSGSAASNITLSSPSSLMNRAGTSVRHDLTCSVTPSDSIMMRWAPASRYRFACRIARDGSETPSAASSATELAPPAPNWIPTSGFGSIPRARTFSTSRTRSSSGIEMNPLDTSTMSNSSRLHSSRYSSTASGPIVSTCSMNPPVDTRTSWEWQVSIRSRTAPSGIRENDPALNLKMSTYVPIVSRISR